ncbi:hypothetical protein LEP1GSC169_2382 [Leptospira santarosai str. HAI1349]|nr:hypothetical protein LEP1GSC169_2382 [Leptospira santarosai str. HAI1349]
MRSPSPFCYHHQTKNLFYRGSLRQSFYKSSCLLPKKARVCLIDLSGYVQERI